MRHKGTIAYAKIEPSSDIAVKVRELQSLSSSPIRGVTLIEGDGSVKVWNDISSGEEPIDMGAKIKLEGHVDRCIMGAVYHYKNDILIRVKGSAEKYLNRVLGIAQASGN